MPSLFPGMDPFLEKDDAWPDFHQRLINRMADAIGDQVDPYYLVKIEEQIYVQPIPEGPPPRPRVADLGIKRTGHPGSPTPAAGVLEAPARIYLPQPDFERQPYLEILDRHSREVVTVVEVLSPSNKRKGRDRDQYETKRNLILASPAHLVEIDLLRRGEPMPAADRPSCCYSVLVSRAELRPEGEFWPIGLRDRLPIIPIPLRAPHPEAAVDLQDLLNRVYDAGRYHHYIYEGPPEPALAAEDLAWAEPFIPRPS